MEDEIREDVCVCVCVRVCEGGPRWQGVKWSVCKGMKYQAEESRRTKA